MSLIRSSAARKISHDSSNTLFRGEVADFREAMRIVIRGMAAEREDTDAYNASLGPGEDSQREDPAIFVEFGMAASVALNLYRQEVDAAEARVVAGLRALAKQGGHAAANYDGIADALESGDYSGLAW